MLNKLKQIALVIVLVISGFTIESLSGITSVVTAAKDWKPGDPIPGGTYTADGFKIKDYTSGIQDPTNLQEFKELIKQSDDHLANNKDGGNGFHRTGWSGYTLKCNRERAFNPDGSRKKDSSGNNISPWVEVENRNSTNQLDTIGWKADEYRTQILRSLSSKYGAELAPAIYEEMHKKGAKVHVAPGTATMVSTQMVYNSTTSTSTASDCETDDEGYYYRNNDIEGTITITIEAKDCKDPEYAKANPEECNPTCDDPEYAAANPEECNPDCGDPTYAAANPEECNPAPKPCDPITPGNIKSCSGADEKYYGKTTPEVYTELKHNTVHQEQWEAMAGVPTTENLYYSIGGSEYMVQVELTSRKGNHVRRDYNYTYDSVMSRVCAKSDVCDDFPVTGWEDEPPEPPGDPNCGEDLTGDELCQTWRVDSKCVEEEWVPPVASSGKPGDDDYEPGSAGYWKCIDYDYQGGWNGYGTVGGASYTWHQDVFFDYVEITKAKVWRIDNGVLTALSPMSPTDEVKAEIRLGTSDGVVSHLAGHPGNAASGRLLYDFEQEEATVQSGATDDNPSGMFTCTESSNYDTVDCRAKADAKAIGNGTRDGPELGGDCDQCISEDYYIFGEGTAKEPQAPGVMAKTNKVTVVSDVLVLTTAEGYESVIYFEQTNIPQTKNLVEHFEYVPQPGAGAWGSNKNMATWPLDRAVTVVSYNGEFWDMDNKYKSMERSPSHGMSSVPNTLQDHQNNHAMKQAINTPLSSKNIEIYTDGIEIIDTFGNGDFQAGPSIVEYVPIFDSNGSEYPDEQKHKADYSNGIPNINKVVIHNPVGTKYSYVVGTLNKDLDRRTSASKGEGGSYFNQNAVSWDLAHKPFDGASFVSLEGRFDVVFPNMGDFPQTIDFGLPQTVENKGPVFTEQMDTTLWTKRKWIVFPINVIFGGQYYAKGSEVEVPVGQENFTFYAPLNNDEMMSGRVEFWAEAINAHDRTDDGGSEYLQNYSRGNVMGVDNTAQHRAVRYDAIDVVGNIGNMVIEDTGDFRWSSYFKKPISGKWFIKDVVPEVDQSKQNKIMGDQVDMFLCKKDTTFGGTLESADCIDDGSNRNLDSHGSQSQKKISPDQLALTPDKNPITQLRDQPIRLGYQIYTDLETTGNYMNGQVNVDYKYYMLNLENGHVQNVDLHAKVKKKYEKIYDGSRGFNSLAQANQSLGHSPIAINWTAEKVRRNYSNTEKTITDGAVSKGGYKTPRGVDYIYGNTQRLELGERNRTFVGNTNKRGVNQNPGNVSTADFYEKGQRWHYQAVLPSSTIATKVGEPLTEESMKQFKNDKFVILVTAEIESKGDVWNLGHDGGPSTAKVKIKNYPERVVTPGQLPDPDPNPSTPPSIITIFTPNKTVENDLDIKGTH